MTAALTAGTWSSLTPIADETNLLVYTVGRNPTRDIKKKRKVGIQATARVKFDNPELVISLTGAVVTQSGFGSMGIGATATGDVANFAAVWRGHDPDDGSTFLTKATDDADIEGEDALTFSLEFTHMPFVVVV